MNIGALLAFLLYEGQRKSLFNERRPFVYLIKE